MLMFPLFELIVIIQDVPWWMSKISVFYV